ncbi:MAG: hypothetical protein WBW48_10525 [Anaerolineae bacterium]
MPARAIYYAIIVLVCLSVAVAMRVTGALLVGRRFVPQAGSVFMIGVVAALLKLLSIGGVKMGPLLGILIESRLAVSSAGFWARWRRCSGLLSLGCAG